jgi:hypothetical protein
MKEPGLDNEPQPIQQRLETRLSIGPSLVQKGHLKKGKFMYAEARRRGFSGFDDV